MFKFTAARKFIANSYTGRGLKMGLDYMGLTAPADVTGMYLRGEQPEYILAACLAIDQIGN